MKTIAICLVVIIAVVSFLPIRDSLNSNALKYSVIKRSIEALDGSADNFVTDFNHMGVLTQAVQYAVAENKKVYFEYATINEWNHGYTDFVSPDGYFTFRLRVREDTSGGYNETIIDFPTTYRIDFTTGSYDDYRQYCKNIWRPIGGFIDQYNNYIDHMDDDIWLGDFWAILPLIPTGLFAIIYVLIIFLFDSVAVVWSLITCVLRCVGFMPLPRVT